MEWTAPKASLALGAGAALVAAGGMVAVSAPLGLAVATTVMTALAGGVGGLAIGLHRQAERTRQELETLRRSMAEERQRNDAFFTELQRRTVESPALVWRAATADIEVLGSLLRDLARTVGEHQAQLEGLNGSARPRAPSPVVQAPAPAPAPPLERGPGHAMDLPVFDQDDRPPSPDAASPDAAHAPSPFMLGELRSTLAIALASDRLELTLQPVVTLPQRRISGYIAGLRLATDDGGVAPDLTEIARLSDMRLEFDRTLVDRAGQALRLLRARNRELTVRCALDPVSLADPMLQSRLRGEFAAEPDLASGFRIELGEEALLSLDTDVGAILRQIGVSLGALVADLAIDHGRMARAGCKHVRIDADDLLQSLAEPAPDAALHPADLPELLRRRGLDLIVSGITAEDVVRELLDYPVSHGEGSLFGEPRGIKPDRLRAPSEGAADAASRPSATAPGEATPPKTPPPATPSPSAPGRTRFRSLLRRA